MLSLAIIVFHNDYAIWIWLLVIVAEGADLIYRRVRHACAGYSWHSSARIGL
jgi:hypothetical protein